MNLDELDLSALQQALGAMKSEDLDALRAMAVGMLSGEDQKAQQTPDPPPDRDPFPVDPAQFAKIASLLSALKSDRSDPRAKLLYALRPMLGEERRKRVDRAAKMLQLISLLPKLRELDLFGG